MVLVAVTIVFANLPKVRAIYHPRYCSKESGLEYHILAGVGLSLESMRNTALTRHVKTISRLSVYSESPFYQSNLR
jgi:hypothetical protein